ncbi:MAG: cytochrome c [Gammaproteobacteria bacterium]|nr:cytochrome c [Gammaproteobacteria bacterium]
MRNKQLLTLFVLCSASSMAFASGMHGGGHDSGQKSMPMGAHWMAPTAEAAKINPVKRTDNSIEKGAKLYQQNCVSCHGENADGNGMAGMMLSPKPANLRDMSGGHPDGDFAYKIKQGRGAMPAWKNTFNDNQVWHLVNFIQTLNERPVANKAGDNGHSDDHSHGS